MEIVCKNCNTSHYLSDDRIPLETKMGKCKQCSAPITVLGKNALDSIELELTQSTPPEQEATKNCDFCGEKILAIAKKCRYCSSMLDGSNDAANSQGVPPIPSSHPLKSVESEITTSQINSSDFKNQSSLNNNLLIAVSPERIEYNKIRLKYQDIAEKAANNFSENWFENMDDLHDRASSVVGGYLNSAINEAICDLVAKGIQDIDEKAFFENYLKISWEDDFSDIDDKYNAIVLNAEELDAYRTARRQDRGRFVGGGFGLEGAINGMAKAGAANLAVGILHGTFNLGAKAITSGINAVKKTQLFNDSYTKTSLVNAAYWQVFLVHFSYIDAINERMPEKVISEWVSNEDKLKAERLFENVKKGRIPNTEIQQILLEVLTLNPYDDTIYMYWMQTYGDDNNSLERTAEYFGVTTFVRDKKAIVAILAIEDELMTEDNRCSPELATKSLDYFIKLANQGNKKAQFHLGMIYMEGIGVTHDATQAISYYMKSAEQKFSNAQFALGVCYENGWGVIKDETQALNWYNKAVEGGNEFAKNALNGLNDKITARENSDFFNNALILSNEKVANILSNEKVANILSNEKVVKFLGEFGVIQQPFEKHPNRTDQLTQSDSTPHIKKFIVQDGIATDIETDLMWCRFNLGQTWKNDTAVGDTERLKWKTAFDAAEQFNRQGGYAGYTDWRLPTIDELKTLIDESNNHIDSNIFPSNNGMWFWSSTLKKTLIRGSALLVDFNRGEERHGYLDSCFGVCLMREK